jgi:hypothetical protein
MPLSTYELTPLLHAIAQITLFDAKANDRTWWTFTKVLPPPSPPSPPSLPSPPSPPPPPAPFSTTPDTRSLSEIKLCTELYGNEGRPSALVNPNAMRLAARKDARWSPGDRLSVYFIGGSNLMRDKVRLSSINH